MNDLAQLVKEIEQEFKNISLIESCLFCDLDAETMNYLLDTSGKNDYYKALAAYQNLYLTDPNKSYNILDIGTYRGGSVAAFKSTLGRNNLLSIDVDLSNLDNNDSIRKGCEIKQVSPDEISKINYSNYDFIFVDVNHLGEQEIRIHKRIIETKYKGLVFYDDILLNQEMIEFWNSIQQNKIKTNWHFSGFGVVEY